MPFVNKEQSRACHAQATRDIVHGYKPRWDCHDFKEGIKSTKRKTWVPLTKKELEVHQGARGGKYRLVDGEKHYAAEFYDPSEDSKEAEEEENREIRKPSSRKRKSSKKIPKKEETYVHKKKSKKSSRKSHGVKKEQPEFIGRFAIPKKFRAFEFRYFDADESRFTVLDPKTDKQYYIELV